MAVSKQSALNLDIKSFRGGGFDPIAYIQANHDKTRILHQEGQCAFGRERYTASNIATLA